MEDDLALPTHTHTQMFQMFPPAKDHYQWSYSVFIKLMGETKSE